MRLTIILLAILMGIPSGVFAQNVFTVDPKVRRDDLPKTVVENVIFAGINNRGEVVRSYNIATNPGPVVLYRQHQTRVSISIANLDIENVEVSFMPDPARAGLGEKDRRKQIKAFRQMQRIDHGRMRTFVGMLDLSVAQAGDNVMMVWAQSRHANHHAIPILSVFFDARTTSWSRNNIQDGLPVRIRDLRQDGDALGAAELDLLRCGWSYTDPQVQAEFERALQGQVTGQHTRGADDIDVQHQERRSHEDNSVPDFDWAKPNSRDENEGNFRDNRRAKKPDIACKATLIEGDWCRGASERELIGRCKPQLCDDREFSVSNNGTAVFYVEADEDFSAQFVNGDWREKINVKSWQGKFVALVRLSSHDLRGATIRVKLKSGTQVTYCF